MTAGGVASRSKKSGTSAASSAARNPVPTAARYSITRSGPLGSPRHRPRVRRPRGPPVGRPPPPPQGGGAVGTRPRGPRIGCRVYPPDRLTLEAVRLYADRVTPDGLVALHVSNKKLWLEPVVARIAEELGLAGRIWNDDGFRRPGKTASGWVVLARDEAALGTIAKPTDEQVVGF